MVPSYSGLPFICLCVLGSVHSLVPSASPTKFSTVRGAFSQNSSAVMVPIDVTKVA